MSPAFLLLGAAGCDSALRIRPCDTLRFGECDDVCDKVPIAVTAQPLYDLDLAVEARSALAYVSTQNPCLLDGLNGVSFADMDGHGSYLTTKEEIQINPLVVPADVKNTADYRFILLYRLYHELGHHVFNYVFGQRCTDIGYEFMHISWNDYYGMKPGMDTDVDHGDFLNADAVRTADEDFAVCFAYYVFLPGEFQKRIAERGAAHPALAQKYAVLKELFDGMEFPIVAPAFVTTAHAHACTTPRGEAWSLRQPLVLKGS